MSPESEAQIKNSLSVSGMFSESQISMAIVVLDPVLTNIENDRDEWIGLSQSLRKTRERLEETIEKLQSDDKPSPELQSGEPSPFAESPYMTIIPNRRPKQKVHSNIGHAHGAISNAIFYHTGAPCDMELYEFKNNKWELTFKVAKGMKREELPWRLGKK